jgi:tetratricopeptide (TPR) repeat protein
MPKNRCREDFMKSNNIKSAESSSEKEKKTIYNKRSRTIEWERVAKAVAILFLAILGISSFFPTERLWGINHLSYYPLWFSALIISLGFLVFIPLVNQGLQGFLRKSVVPAFSFLVEKRKRLGFFIIISIFLLFFYLFRTRTHFLGDGAQIISNINSGTLPIKWTNPLASWIYLFAYDLLNKFSHFDGASVYALISYLCGAVFVFFALRLADLLGKIASTKLFVFLVLTFMGGSELFLGYAEHYPLFYSGILIYLFYSIKCLKGETKLFLPMLFFFILLPIHFFSLYLFPSAIFLFLSAGGEAKAKPMLKTKRIWMVSPVLILAVASLIIYFWKYGWYSLGYFVPLFSGSYYAPYHTLFSLPHLMDFLNQQLLVSPIGFLLFLIFLILRPIGAKRRSRHIGGEGLDSKDKIFQFLLIVSISQLFLNFVVDPGLGAARDWDLFASVGLGFTVLALYVFGKIPPNPRIGYLKLSLTIIVLVFSLPWMGINANADLSVRRFRNLLDLDPKKSLNGHHILAVYFDNLGKPEEVDQEERMQVEKFPEASLVKGGLKLLKNGDLDNAYLNFTQALQIAPNFAEVHWALGEYYFKIGDLEKAEVELMKAIDLRADHGPAHALSGTIFSLRKNLKKARKMLERALVLGVEDQEVYRNLGNIYLRSQNWDKAILAYQKAIQMNDESAEPHLGLALAFFQQGKLEKSLKEANRALQKNPDYAPAYYQLGRIYSTLGMKRKSLSALKKYLELAPNGPLANNVGELIKELENQ